jgi:hypothetical protein
LVVPNIFNLITNPFNLSIPTQEVVDPNNVVPYIGTPYVVNNIYAPIIEPTLTKPREMPPWQIIVLPYMVGYSSSTSVTIHISLAPPTDFPLGNSGGLSKKIGYMGNVRRPSEPQVMTKF